MFAVRRTHRRAAGALVISAVALGSTTLITLAQAPASLRNAKEGVYTSGQATSGKSLFLEHCSRCHGTELQGGNYDGDSVPGLKRGDFMDRGDLGGIYKRVRNLMPVDKPGVLSDAQAVEIVSFLLQSNGFPGGSAELTADPGQLASIRLSKNVPARNGSLVQVVGCLARGAGNNWTLVNGSEAVVAADPSPSPADLQSAAEQPLGTRLYGLMNPPPGIETHNAHKMEARGLLIRSGKDDRINISSLETVATDCAR